MEGINPEEPYETQVNLDCLKDYEIKALCYYLYLTLDLNPSGYDIEGYILIIAELVDHLGLEERYNEYIDLKIKELEIEGKLKPLSEDHEDFELARIIDCRFEIKYENDLSLLNKIPCYFEGKYIFNSYRYLRENTAANFKALISYVFFADKDGNAPSDPNVVPAEIINCSKDISRVSFLAKAANLSDVESEFMLILFREESIVYFGRVLHIDLEKRADFYRMILGLSDEEFYKMVCREGNLRKYGIIKPFYELYSGLTDVYIECIKQESFDPMWKDIVKQKLVGFLDSNF